MLWLVPQECAALVVAKVRMRHSFDTGAKPRRQDFGTQICISGCLLVKIMVPDRVQPTCSSICISSLSCTLALGNQVMTHAS